MLPAAPGDVGAGWVLQEPPDSESTNPNPPLGFLYPPTAVQSPTPGHETDFK